MNLTFRKTVSRFIFASCALMVGIVFTSCQKSTIDNEEVMPVVFSDNGVAVRGSAVRNYNLDNCGKIHVSTSIKSDDGSYIELKLQLLTNGDLAEVVYTKQNSDADGSYNTPNLEAYKSFKINEFNYDRSSGNLSFKFDGSVFSSDSIERKLVGNVRVNSISHVDCDGLIFDVLSKSKNFQFFSMHSSASKRISDVATEPDDEHAYTTYSTTGQRIVFLLGKDISKFVNTSTEISSDVSRLPRMIYEEYHGHLTFVRGYGGYDRFYKQYEIHGILSDVKRVDKGDKSTKPYYTGKITMNILDEGAIVHSSINMAFSASAIDKVEDEQ